MAQRVRGWTTRSDDEPSTSLEMQMRDRLKLYNRATFLIPLGHRVVATGYVVYEPSEEIRGYLASAMNLRLIYRVSEHVEVDGAIFYRVETGFGLGDPYKMLETLLFERSELYAVPPELAATPFRERWWDPMFLARNPNTFCPSTAPVNYWTLKAAKP